MHINGLMMKLNYCWLSRKNTKRSNSPKAPYSEKKICVFTNFRIRVDGALTSSSAVFACQKRDYLVQHRCICHLLYWAVVRELYLSYEFFSYDRHDDMETISISNPYRCICRVCRTKNIHRTDTTLWKPPVQMLNTKETTDTTCCTR